jgi:hypothetical protein
VNGERKDRVVAAHQLFAGAFFYHLRKPGQFTVNHINKDTRWNALRNLEFASAAEQKAHASSFSTITT